MGFETDLRAACRIIQQAVIEHNYRLNIRDLQGTTDKDLLAKELIRNAESITIQNTDSYCVSCFETAPIRSLVEGPTGWHYCRPCYTDTQVP